MVFCVSQPLILDIQPPTVVLCGTVLSKHTQSVPRPWSWSSLVGRSEAVFFMEGIFFIISASKRKLRIIHCSLTWWIWIYIELNFLLLLLSFFPSMQTVLILGLFAHRSLSTAVPFTVRGQIPLRLRLPVHEASFTFISSLLLICS